MSRIKRVTWLGIALFWLLQLTLGVRGLVMSRDATRGDFSWNMYSDRYRCAVHYTVHDTQGHVQPVDFEAHFATPVHSGRLLHRDRLPRYHRWLCAERVPSGSELHGLVSCRVNEGRWIDLVPPGVDLCTLGREP